MSMRSYWNQIPMFRIALAVFLGIGLEIFVDSLFQSSSQLMPFMLPAFLLSFLTILLISLSRKVELAYRFRLLLGISATVMLVSFGYMHVWLYSDKNHSSHFQNYLYRDNFLVAKIVNPPLEKEKIIKVVAEVMQVHTNGYTVSTAGKMLISILRDSTNLDVKYGDVIVFNSKIEAFEEPKNPDEFSYKLYQSFHNIYHRTFLKPGSWRLLQHNQGNFFMGLVYQARDYLLSIITRYVKGKNEFAVASAIMLGYNDYLTGDITQAYASSGALHVLSVSGLHVGIMFFMLNILFKPMDSGSRKVKIAKALIIILLIWGYACLTGLSPSVLRSAMMFSMIQMGKVLFRNVNTYNVIFGSAFILLLFNPFIITEVGFRLSYLAVIGIIYLQPQIYALISFKNKILDQGWMIIAVSLAAQIATFPLSLLYFHQFPNLFLISNLVVIPASNLILFVGTGLLAVGQIPYLNDWVGWGFDMLLTFINWFIFYIDNIPFALISGISITMLEMILLYVLILLLCWLTEERRAKVLIISLVIVLGLTSFYAYEVVRNSVQKKLMVYSIPKHSAVAFIVGRKVLCSFDEQLLENESSMLFHVRHHWWSCGVKQEEIAQTKQLPIGKLIQFENHKILFIDTAIDKIDCEMQHRLRVDLVVISHNPKVYLENLGKAVEFHEVIFDSTNQPWRVQYWKKDCNKLKLRYWDIATQGAYIKNYPHLPFLHRALGSAS